MYLRMASNVSLLKSALGMSSRFVKAAGTEAGSNFVKKMLGVLSQPLLIDHGSKLREEISKADEFSSNSSASSSVANTKLSILKSFKENFALGDALSLAGLAMLSILDRFNKSSQKLGLFQSSFKQIATALTFIGSPAAAFGRITGAKEEFALGRENMGELYIEKARQAGHRIFHKYSLDEIKELQSELPSLREKLVYDDSIAPEIKLRHLRFTGSAGAGNEISAFFCGPPGTGKTEGVKYILGNITKEIKARGKEPVIAKLDLADYQSFIEDLERGARDTRQAIGALVANDEISNLSLNANLPFIIFESLISRSYNIAQKVKADNNHAQTPIIFIDEFDKVAEMSSFQNVSPHRLKNLLLRLNQLLDDQNLLLTSNAPMDDIIGRFRSAFRGDMQYKHILDAFENRLRNIHVPILAPNESTQAKIIAASLLKDHREYINWDSFGIEAKSGIKELDKTLLADAINKLITKPRSTSYVGRDIYHALKSVIPHLVNLAEKYRIMSDSPIPDSRWSQMSPEDKIRETGASISPDFISKLLKIKSETMQSGFLSEHLQKAYSIIESYLEQVQAHSSNAIGFRSDNILDLLAKVYNKSNLESRDIYSSKQVINIGNENYIHNIVYEKPNLHSPSSAGNIRIEFIKYNPENNSVDTQSKKLTQAMSLSEFSKHFSPKINSVLESNQQRAFKNVLSSATELLNPDNKKNPADSVLGSALNNIVKLVKPTVTAS